MKRIGPGHAARSELLARAVEQIVCTRLGVETEPLDVWVGTSVMEAVKFRDPFLGYDQALAAAKRMMTTAGAEERVTEILALARLTKAVAKVKSERARGREYRHDKWGPRVAKSPKVAT